MSKTKKISGCMLQSTALIVFSLFLVPFVLPSQSYAQNGEIKEEQIVEINKSLKNAIEQNQELAQQNQVLEDELSRIKEESSAGQDKYVDLKRERDGMAVDLNRARSANQTYSQQVNDLERSMKNAQMAGSSSYSDSSSEDFMQLAMAADDKEEAVAAPEVVSREGETMDLLSKIDAFTETDERLRADAARAHYNMGNIYYQKGEYEIAAREYYQAVTLMPDDPDAHYNLALTSSQNLHDFKTALKHYKMYLYLNPDAKDAAFVHEKIVEAELNLRSHVDSKLDGQVE